MNETANKPAKELLKILHRYERDCRRWSGLVGPKPKFPDELRKYMSLDEGEDPGREDLESLRRRLEMQDAHAARGDSDRFRVVLQQARSELRKQVVVFLGSNPKASDKAILTHLQTNHPQLIPQSWHEDPKLAGDTFTKVRKQLNL